MKKLTLSALLLFCQLTYGFDIEHTDFIDQLVSHDPVWGENPNFVTLKGLNSEKGGSCETIKGMVKLRIRDHIQYFTLLSAFQNNKAVSVRFNPNVVDLRGTCVLKTLFLSNEI